MVGPQDFATVVLPAVVELSLPRNLAQKVLQIGQKLLVFDPAVGEWDLNQPAARAIALALLDNDPAQADAWLSELRTDYNEYVQDAVEHGQSAKFIP